MANLDGRLKRAENSTGIADSGFIHKIFVRMAPGVQSEAEKRFWAETKDLSRYRVLAISWENPAVGPVGV